MVVAFLPFLFCLDAIYGGYFLPFTVFCREALLMVVAFLPLLFCL